MKIAVLVSGGVDSSVALALIKQAYPKADIHAYYLKIWLEDELSFLGDCPWDEDLRYARAVTETFDVPLEVIPLQQAYHDRVVEEAIAELKRGLTPSPDLYCNERIKFGAFLDAIGPSFDFVATGHYARIRHSPNGPSRLFAGIDPVKDQTYFLARLHQDQARRALFPIGEMPKAEVRERAAALGLPTAQRQDSQGICFLGKIPYNEFVRHHLGDQPGPIVNRVTGQELGTHRGLWFHTIGQRKGLGLGGGPFYVVDKDMETQSLGVVHQKDRAAYLSKSFEVGDLHWIAGPPDLKSLDVKLRHGPRRYRCEVTPSDNGLQIELASPDAGIAPGQFAVFYHPETLECFGSGHILPG